jgi:hypothetical protein
VAAAITPVPGGVGPLTNALLLAHLVRAARGQEAAVEAAGGAPLHASVVSPIASADAPAASPATVSGDRVVTS